MAIDMVFVTDDESYDLRSGEASLTFWPDLECASYIVWLRRNPRWDGQLRCFVRPCPSCDARGRFPIAGEPHLYEPCYDCTGGWRHYSPAVVRRARRARRRELLRLQRQARRLGVETKTRCDALARFLADDSTKLARRSARKAGAWAAKS